MNKEIERNIEFNVLNAEKIEKIHHKSIEIMEKFGMRVSGERALALFKKAGATVDQNGIVYIPEKLTEWAINKAPKTLDLYNRDGEVIMHIDEKTPVYFGTHSDQLEYVDPETGRVRNFNRSDIASMCKIANAMEHIYFVLSVGMTKDVDPRVQTQSTFIETLKHFEKTINFSSNDVESLQDCIDIAADIAGGLDKLQEKPFIFNYCEPIPPLTHPLESTEKIITSAENRIPFVYMPYCMMGGTSPMNRAATYAQCNAEALTGLVLTQLVSEGAPFIYGAMPSVFDMKTTIGSYAAPEFHLGIAAHADLVASYGLPFYGTAGCTDAKTIDAQAVSEVSYEIFSTLLSKAHIIHDVGVMDHCNSVSPELVVLANEIIESYSHYSSGVRVEEEDFAMDVIEEVGHGGEYMTNMHTLTSFKEVWYPELFSRRMKNFDQSDVAAKIKGKALSIIQDEGASLDHDRLGILTKWEKKFGL